MKHQWRWILMLVPVTLLLTGWDAAPPDESTPGTAAPVVEKTSLGARTAIIPTLAWVIGSYDAEERANLMTASWVGVCASRPAAVMIGLRPATYTHGNIMARRAFTVNIGGAELARYAAYVGRVSGRTQDKFTATGLTPVKSDLVDAPYVQEYPLIAECKVTKTVEAGSHTLFIGEIVDVKADPAVLNDAGVPVVEKLNPVVYSPGSGAFYGLGPNLGAVSELAGQAVPKRP